MQLSVQYLSTWHIGSSERAGHWATCVWSYRLSLSNRQIVHLLHIQADWQVLVLKFLWSTIIERYYRSVRPAEKKIGPRHTSPVFILMVHNVSSAAKMTKYWYAAASHRRKGFTGNGQRKRTETCDGCQTSSFEHMCERSLLAYSRAVGMIEVAPHSNAAKTCFYDGKEYYGRVPERLGSHTHRHSRQSW